MYESEIYVPYGWRPYSTDAQMVTYMYLVQLDLHMRVFSAKQTFEDLKRHASLLSKSGSVSNAIYFKHCILGPIMKKIKEYENFLDECIKSRTFYSLRDDSVCAAVQKKDNKFCVNLTLLLILVFKIKKLISFVNTPMSLFTVVMEYSLERYMWKGDNASVNLLEGDAHLRRQLLDYASSTLIKKVYMCNESALRCAQRLEPLPRQQLPVVRMNGQSVLCEVLYDNKLRLTSLCKQCVHWNTILRRAREERFRSYYKFVYYYTKYPQRARFQCEH